MVKIILEVMGYYERFLEDGTEIPRTSLDSLIHDLRVISTHQKYYHIGTVQKLFGLDFLPIQAVTDLIQKASEQSPLLTDQMLRPLVKKSQNFNLNRFSYRFVTQNLEPKNFRIPLDDQNPTIPENFSHYDRHPGVYKLDLEKYAKSSTLQAIRNESIHNLEQFIHNKTSDFIEIFLNGATQNQVSIPLPKNCTAIMDIDELEPTLRSALNVLQGQADDKAASQPVLSLIQQYRDHYPEPIFLDDRIPNLKPENSPQKAQIVIGTGNHRHILEDLITKAKKFLLICSYRLEDIRILELIAEKSKSIPVWILTDFRNNVQDRVDSYIDNFRDIDDAYIHSDLKKVECLIALSEANLGFRSGNFHLKTYISEQSAYLGSCNLTGGSLGRNGEAGMIWHQTSEHQFLIDYFRYLWDAETDEKAIPSRIGFQTESIEKISDTLIPESDLFLDNHAFKVNLSQSLRKFNGEPIRIYTRNFSPLSPQFNLLKSSATQVFYGAHNNTGLQASKINNLHAKIILIGSQVAYIGSQDCAFAHSPLIDLTYKTTNSQEIQQIYQAIQNLH